jgi:hypothetical protein
MPRMLCLVFGFITMLSCLRPKEKIVNKDHYLVPKGRLKELLDSFVQVAGNNHPVYEVFVVKMSPFEANLILHSGNKSLCRLENKLEGQFPANKTQACGVTFYVYSGVERYFNNPENAEKDSSKYMEKGGENEVPYALWAVKDSAGIYRVFSTITAYPFIGIPDPITDTPKFKVPQVPTTNNDK